MASILTEQVFFEYSPRDAWFVCGLRIVPGVLFGIDAIRRDSLTALTLPLGVTVAETVFSTAVALFFP